MVFGHNLQHMAPFEILEAGFCTVFRRASFWFSVPGVKSGPGSRIGHGLGLAALGSPKGKYFCGRMVLPQGGTGGPKGGMDSRGVATPLGRPVPPKPTLEKLVYRDFHFFPLALALGPCLGPVGALNLFQSY